MPVPVRYILAALAFAVAALGFILLPSGTTAEPDEPARPERHHIVPPPQNGGAKVMDAAVQNPP